MKTERSWWFLLDQTLCFVATLSMLFAHSTSLHRRCKISSVRNPV